MKALSNQSFRQFCLSTIMAVMAMQANAQDFYVAKQHPEVNKNLFDKCGKVCPEIDYYFVDTGNAWLDAIINKDITTALSVNSDDKAQEKKQWQKFAKNPMPSDSEYTERLNVAISRLVADNKSIVTERGKNFDNSVPPVQVTAKPIYLGHKDNLELFANEFYQFMGGAHGMDTKIYYVFDMNQKKQLTLNDVLQPNQKAKLETLVKAEFVKFLIANDIKPSEHFKSWPFMLTDNYSFNRQGITFLYQPYEIGFYALGAPQLTVPYSQLNGIVKPQYLK